MDRQEINRLWNSSQQSSAALRNLPDWLRWRVTKKWAKWSGRPQRQSAKLFWGQPMTVVYPEYVSSKIGRYGFFESDVTAMFLDVLRPGMVVYDVGSHYGYFSLLASAIVGNAGHVYAFEPTAATYDVLQENAARRDNITCNNVAAYRETGKITFWDQGLHDSSLNFIVHDETTVDTDYQRSSGKLITVPAVKLDEFANEHQDPDFLKIDAEGAEGPILEGLVEVIQRCHPGISLEMGDTVCEKTGNRPCSENLEFLLDHGYEVFDYAQGVSNQHAIESRYIYGNLFFRHPEWRYSQQPVAAAA